MDDDVVGRPGMVVPGAGGGAPRSSIRLTVQTGARPNGSTGRRAHASRTDPATEPPQHARRRYSAPLFSASAVSTCRSSSSIRSRSRHSFRRRASSARRLSGCAAFCRRHLGTMVGLLVAFYSRHLGTKVPRRHSRWTW